MVQKGPVERSERGPNSNTLKYGINSKSKKKLSVSKVICKVNLKFRENTYPWGQRTRKS